MKKQILIKTIFISLFLLAAFIASGQMPGGQWTKEKAWKWYNENPWFCGFNYIPANAINYTAMWDKTSFAPDVIDRELALAETTGFNCVRVVLQFIVWEEDPKYFRDTFKRFLTICSKYRIKVMPAFFDDCVFGTNRDPNLGKQPEPFEGWYAWAWSPSPGHTMVIDTTTHGRIEKYVKDVMTAFRDDPAIFAWDLYNEPTNSGLGSKSMPLVKSVFRWAREVNPSQPVTIGYWNTNKELNDFILAHSDIITFHSYSEVEAVGKLIQTLKEQGRPVICTEWLNRPRGSTVESILPLFFRENVGAMHWGLVNGKTQTDLPWGHRPADMPYNRIWQHDLYTTDFKMYSPYEMELFKSYIARSKKK